MHPIPSFLARALSGSLVALAQAPVTKPANRAPVFAPSQQSAPKASRLQDVIEQCDDLDTHDIGAGDVNSDAHAWCVD